MAHRDDIARAAREQLAEEVLLLLLTGLRNFLDGKASLVMTHDSGQGTRTFTFKNGA